MNPVDRNLK